MGVSVKIARSQIRFLKKIIRELGSVSRLRELEGKNYSRNLRRLEQKKLIILGDDEIKLSSYGLRILKKIDQEDVKIKAPSVWDGQWHIIAYDIPEEMKSERNCFRSKIKELGFSKLQASMWLYPYECKEEIAIFAYSIGVSPFIIYLTTDRVPGNSFYIKKYKLLFPKNNTST